MRKIARKKKMDYMKAIATFLTSIILVQVLVFTLALFSLLLPYVSSFFFVSGNPTLYFWVLVGIALGVLMLSIYLSYQKNKWGYLTFIISGILLGLVFAVALMSVFIF